MYKPVDTLYSKNLYYSTNLKAPEVTFREALLQGLATDGGLYMPLSIPVISEEEIETYPALDYYEIAFRILRRFTGNDIEDDSLLSLCRNAYNFDIPLENVYDRIYVMRLDQGPTASFKDFAARMMGRLMQHFLSLEERYLTILTATSGDTGSAVANAFYGLKNIRVIILFPANEITVLQRKQMTTLNDNVLIIAINGKFDDCQKLVKSAFVDPSLSHIPLSSANSINIGRLLPQTVYYFYAWSRLSGKTDDTVIFSVPSGNFGNLMGGIIAREMSLPVKKFIVSTNENDEVPVYLKTGNYVTIIPSINCISSAMNVGHPGNMARIVALYGGIMDEKGVIIKAPDLEKMREDLFAVRVSDNETMETIRDCYKHYGLLLEPHGAVAWKGLQTYLKHDRAKVGENMLCISLETAYPAKFQNEIERLLNFKPHFPPSLSEIENKTENFLPMDNNYDIFKSFILRYYKQ